MEDDDLYTLTRVFRALSDETRLKLLNLVLENGEIQVGQLVEKLTCTQANVSKQLDLLEYAQLIQRRREGRKVFISAYNPKVLEIYQKAVANLLSNN